MKPNPLLAMLSDGEVHSGESLAIALGISRTAVWKQIRRAIADGVEVRTIRGQGYQLLSTLDLLSQSEILAAMPEASAEAIALTVVDSVDSTNAEVARRLLGARGAVPVVISDSQSAGRGRRGRVWASPKGQNLYLSLGLNLAGGFSSLDGLSLLLGVAVASAIENLGGGFVELKWPNDLFAEKRKFGGILVEIQGELQEGCVQVIAGIGINVHMAGVANIDQPWTSLDGFSPQVAWSRNALAAEIIQQILTAIAEFSCYGFKPFQERWLARDIFCGKELKALGGQLIGIGRGIDHFGNYLVETPEGIETVRAGDLSLRVNE